jgi:hypothetical protein
MAAENEIVEIQQTRENANSNPSERIERSFHQGISDNRGDRHLLIVAGANHFSLAYPEDTATGRAYLDQPVQGDPAAIRSYIGDIITRFCMTSIGKQDIEQLTLDELLNPVHPLAAIAASK